MEFEQTFAGPDSVEPRVLRRVHQQLYPVATSRSSRSCPEGSDRGKCSIQKLFARRREESIFAAMAVYSLFSLVSCADQIHLADGECRLQPGDP